MFVCTSVVPHSAKYEVGRAIDSALITYVCVCVFWVGETQEKYEMALGTLLTSIFLKSHSPTFFCRRRLSGRFAALPTYCALSESFLLNQLLPAFRQSSQSVICTPLWIVCRCSTGTAVVLLRTTANGWVLVLWFPTGPLWARNIILVSNSACRVSLFFTTSFEPAKTF